MGFTWDYLHHGLPFNIIQKILIDFPSVEVEDNEDEGTGELREETAAEFAKRMNNFTL